MVVGTTAAVSGTDWVVITELLQSEVLATSRAALLLLGIGNPADRNDSDVCVDYRT